MRIARLSLLAFGPFTNGELGFSPKPGVLDMIYGPNEAGKSTTLRALTALLYGIPARTGDAHLHEMTRMRIGASLVDERGRSLSLIRRKGAKHTLLDANDEPLPDSALGELLGGLDETMFRQMFGLDHERLREGAEALLSGGGNLGESLFDAGSGARAIRAVLAGLKQEADELFKPRGPTTKLQQAVRALRERQRERKEAALSPQTFVEQRRALGEARAALDTALTRRRELLREQSRLSRALSALPLFARRDVLLGERRELGDVRGQLVPQTAELEPTLEREERERARLEGDAARLEGVLAALPAVPSGGLAREPMRELEQRYGRYRKALGDLPLKRAELAQAEAEVALLRTRLGSAVCALDRLDTPARTRLRALTDDEQRQRLSCEELDEALSAAELELAARLAERAACAVPEGSGSLRELLRRAEQDERVTSLARREAELAQKRAAIQRGLAQLSLSGLAERLTELVLPDESELERLERAQAELAGERTRLDQARLERARHAARLSDERAQLLADGDVVTEETLARARGERAQAFDGLLTALRAREGEERALVAFQRAEARADELADRLRREAARASTLSRIERDERTAAEATARAAELEAALGARESELAGRARTLLSPAGLTELPLAAARAACKKLELLRERAAEVQALALELASVHAAADDLRAALGRALASEPASLTEAIASARAALAQDDEGRVRREALEVRAHDARARRDELARKLTRAREALARTQQAYRDELGGLGFASVLSPPEVLASLDDLTALQTRTRQVESLGIDLAALERESARFEAELAALCREYAPAAAERPAFEAMAELVQAHQQSHDVARERERVAAALGRVREELAAKVRATEALREERDRVFESLGVTSFAALRELEQREKRAATLNGQLEQLELQLATASEGRSLDELRAEALSLDPDDARARLDGIEGELGVVGEEIDQRNQEIGRLSAGLEQLSGASGAVALAEEAESDLAEVQGLARRYAELRLGHALLAREVERYRAAHQGPVLERAAALFPRLTLGRYKGLEVELDERDQPVLACVRDSGKTVRVDGLSDGTRDQLYLALRVASIERYLGKNQPMPLVLDDAFIHFDDARAAAALAVLGELSQRTQVLFFTHHARMLELGKKALGKDKVLVHELDPVRGVVRTRDDGPLFARV